MALEKIIDRITWDKWPTDKLPDIRQDGFDFVMDTMPFNARFKGSIQEGLIYEAEGKSISFKPVGMWWVQPQEQTIAYAVAPITGNLVNGKAKYSNALGNETDIECSTGCRRWRKQVIIKSLKSLGPIPAEAEFLEIKFEIDTDFEIEGWDKESKLEFTKAIKLGENSWIESIKSWDSSPVEFDGEGNPVNKQQRHTGILKKEGDKLYLIKQIPVEWLKKAVFPVWTDVDITYGSIVAFNAADTAVISVTMLDSTHFVVVYKDEGGDDYGCARVGVISGTDTITFGAEYIFASAIVYMTSVAALDSTHFVVGYQLAAGGAAIIGIVSSGDVIAYGTEYIFNAVSTTYISVAALDATHFVVGYRDNGGDTYAHAQIGVVSGTPLDDITFGTEYAFNAAASSFISVAMLDSTHFVMVATNDGGAYYGIAKVGVVSGTPQDDITFGTEYVYNAANTVYNATTALDATHFVVAFRDGADNYQKAMVGVVSSGNVITFGAEYQFAITNVSFSIAFLDATHFVIVIRDYNDLSYGKAAIGTVSSGDVIAYGTFSTFNAANSMFGVVTALDATHFAIAYTDSGGSLYGEAVIGTYTVLYNLSITDGVNQGDAMAGIMTASLGIADGMSPGDAPSELGQFPVSSTDGLTPGDAAQLLASLCITDGLKPGDSISIIMAAYSSLTDGLKPGDAAQLIALLGIADGIGFGDTTLSAMIASLAVADGANLGDVAQLLASLCITDGVRLGDLTAEEAVAYLLISEVINHGDTPVTTMVANAQASDGTSLGDSAAGAMVVSLELSEGTHLGDVTLVDMLASLAVSDRSNLGESAALSMLANALSAEGMKLGDALSCLATGNVTLSDAIAMGDTTSVTLLAVLSLIDGLGLGDAAWIRLGRGKHATIKLNDKSFSISFNDKSFDIPLNDESITI